MTLVSVWGTVGRTAIKALTETDWARGYVGTEHRGSLWVRSVHSNMLRIELHIETRDETKVTPYYQK